MTLKNGTPSGETSHRTLNSDEDILATAPKRTGKSRSATVQRLDNTGPGTLDKPVFLMNCPFSFSTECPNNIWMVELEDEQRKVNRSRAISQFAQLYSYMASDALVFLLPTPRDCTLQDLVFTANLAIIPHHIPGGNTVIVSKYASEPRVRETELGVQFFNSMGYNVHVAPYHFEGEAELKHLYDNVYIGGYGIRSDRRAFDWMEAEFDMKIVKIKETDEYLYHLDCSVFPVTPDDTMICTKMFSKKEISQIEKVTNIIDVTEQASYAGICNSVRHHNSILNGSHLHT